uniref:Ig-like domain-containing protein n=1 Tax=Sander lucioperca TaxID=283035 RepID=A0A8C9XKE5_SANLU
MSRLLHTRAAIFPCCHGNVMKGEDAVLGCSFTHPYQQHYSGKIAVKWLAREARAPPFFSCSVNNDSMEGRVGCSDSELKYSLEGDPRRGELSLLFRKVHLGDNGTYFCRVELEGAWQNIQKKTQLYVTAYVSMCQHIMLQCEAEGHPLPTVTWLPASTSLMGEQVQTSQAGPYRLASSVPYLQDDVFTCRAESRLGAAEQTFPDHNTLKITLTVGGLIVLLLLLSIGFFCYMRNREWTNRSRVSGRRPVKAFRSTFPVSAERY